MPSLVSLSLDRLLASGEILSRPRINSKCAFNITYLLRLPSWLWPPASAPASEGFPEARPPQARPGDGASAEQPPTPRGHGDWPRGLCHHPRPPGGPGLGVCQPQVRSYRPSLLLRSSCSDLWVSISWQLIITRMVMWLKIMMMTWWSIVMWVRSWCVTSS